MAKRRAESAREGKGKTFDSSVVIGGSAVNEAHGKLRRRGHTASVGPSPLTNQILDSLEGYLDNISVVATKTVAKGGPLAELAASLVISVDTVAQRQQEIKRMYEQINAMKKRWTQASSIGTTEGGGLSRNVCPYFAAVGRTTPHKNNSCYFDPKKMTDIREGSRKLMDEKGVT